ncbi:hypothetical protein IF1G_02551 [Cordyceps javanica]|uniref:BTB domain-containing protein n=1 Tax=Cordyceps javanica TaxID=43265 RepID=A0A545V9S1_9HYPO|nr:hypothetical protein IF1G_02551 [Cordyceps javanica]TQW09688.1 hypothetical protein IF2G_02478 [Cordyceps javanica]
MRQETVLQTAYLPGKTPPAAAAAAAAAVMGPPRSSSKSTTTTTTSHGSHHRTTSSASAMPSPLRPPPRPRSQSTSAVGETTTVLVGRHRQPFVVDRRLLCAASPFFRDRLQRETPATSATPSPVSASSASGSSPRSLPSHGGGGGGRSGRTYTDRPVTLWLPGESATMFGLFVQWLHAPHSFRLRLDVATVTGIGIGIGAGTAAAAAATTAATTNDESAAQRLHWALVRLHLFAAHLGLPVLQDLAMDAVQDLYLRRDWDMAPSVIAYLYTRCEARHAGRLRRWAVAMVAFSLAVAEQEDQGQGQQQQQQQRPRGGGSSSSSYLHHQRTVSASSSSSSPTSTSTSTSIARDPARLHSMLAALPEFAADYAGHVRSMRGAGLDMRFKNPQLRIPANGLRSDKRAFGFRECSFHSHRAAVGEGPCPHAASGGSLPTATDASFRLDLGRGAASAAPLPPVEDYDDDDDEEEEERDEVDEDDDRRQWEKEWADEFLAMDDVREYTCVPRTSGWRSAVSFPMPPTPKTPRPRPQATVADGSGSARPLVSKFGQHVRLASRDGSMLTPTPG